MCVENQMWILKNAKEQLDNIQSRYLSTCNKGKTCASSTIYAISPVLS
jgi:hypothetical protein